MALKRKKLAAGYYYRCHYLASHYTVKLLNSALIDQEEVSEVSSSTLEGIIGKALKIKNIDTGADTNADADTDIDVEQYISRLNDLLNVQDKTPIMTKRLVDNVTMLVNSLELDEVAAQVIQCAAVVTLNRGLFEFINTYIYFNIESSQQLFSVILDIDELKIEQALDAILSTGLFTTARLRAGEPLMLPHAITQKLVLDNITAPIQILDDLLYKPLPPELTLAHFDYLDIELTQWYLTAALATKEQGVNILFYGAPGTGKTQLTRLLAQEMAVDLFEVLPVGKDLWQQKSEFETNETSGALRMQYNQLIQKLLGRTSNALLVIDECEDLFVNLNGEDRISKEALHHVLETNHLPTLWLTNHVECLDESCLRRFKMIVEFPKPSSASIKTLIDKRLKGLATREDFRQQLAYTKHLTMAHVDNAATVVRQVGLTRKSAEFHLNALIESTLTACGYQQALRYQGAHDFNLNYVNLSGEFSDLTQLINATSKYCSARTLLTGASGTGKTALVNYLAQALDRELVTVRCSDILSQYVGESEQKVAKVFKQASDAGAMLFFDEVDSLLASRENMQNGYEVQLVNELLTQIECFDQPLFAATNFHQRLDKAVLRRFDFKLHFAPLTTKQVLAMYRQIMHIKVIPKAIVKQLSTMAQLTPGDFALVTRRQQFSPKTLNHQQVILLLLAENNRKRPQPSIGFVHPQNQG